ncbi:MAG: hypothetical protein U1A78_03910 [Polyangia bacterium]
MRTLRLGFSSRRALALAAAVAGVGGAAVAVSIGAGCGTLWRPFLEGTAPSCSSPGGEQPCDPSCDPGCAVADLGVDLQPPEWERIPSTTPAALRAVWGRADETVVYLGGDGNTLLSWRPGQGVRGEVHPGSPTSNITSIAGDLKSSTIPVFAAGTGNLLLVWDGRNWFQKAPTTTGEDYFSVSYANNTVWFVGKPGIAYYGPTQGPYTAAYVPGAPNTFPAAVAPNTDSSSVWIGANDVLFRSYGGNTLSYPLPSRDRITGLWGGATVPVVGCDAGPCPCDFGPCISGGPFWYAATEGGQVLRFDTSGAASAQYKLPLPAPALTAVYGNTLGEVWVVGRAGTVLRYDGSQWHSVDVGTTEDLFGVWCAPGSRQPWLVGANGLLLRRRAP